MGRWALVTTLSAACLYSGTAAAQVALGTAASPGMTITRPPDAPRPAPGAPRGAGSAERAADLFRAHPETYAPRFDGRSLLPPPFSVVPYGYVTPGYFPYYPAHIVERVPGSVQQTDTPPGYLRLQVTPLAAQVFVNGFFVGSVQDLGGRLLLDAGSHRVEIRAAGFDPVAFDVRVRGNGTITYTSDLRRTETAAPPATPARAAPAKTLYVIPGCYAGDKRPLAAELRPGCKAADVRVLKP